MLKSIDVTMKDVRSLERVAHFLDIYSREREDYDKKESREAKQLANYVYKWAVRVARAK